MKAIILMVIAVTVSSCAASKKLMRNCEHIGQHVFQCEEMD